VSNAAETALIWVADSNQPAAVLALDQLQGRTPVVWTITALVAALSLAICRTGLVGRWLGVAGLVAAVIFLLGSVFSVLGPTPEGSSSLVGVGLFIIWMLALTGLSGAPPQPVPLQGHRSVRCRQLAGQQAAQGETSGAAVQRVDPPPELHSIQVPSQRFQTNRWHKDLSQRLRDWAGGRARIGGSRRRGRRRFLASAGAAPPGRLGARPSAALRSR
jgi:hypothetical protein